MHRPSLLDRDPYMTTTFMQEHSELIAEYIELRKSQHHSMMFRRMKLAQLAREQFGYASSTSSVDIVNTIVRKFKRRSYCEN